MSMDIETFILRYEVSYFWQKLVRNNSDLGLYVVEDGVSQFVSMKVHTIAVGLLTTPLTQARNFL